MRYERTWNERKRARKKDPVSGVFRQLENDEPDETDDEEEDDLQFLNFQEMNSMQHGKTFVQGRRQKELKGHLVNQQRGRGGGFDPVVQGCFHFTQPWWKIYILRTKGPNRNLRKQNDRFSLGYEIRQDNFVVENKCMFQFLKSIAASKDDSGAEAAEKFEDFVKNTLGREQHLKFEYLTELLDLYEECLPEDEKMQATFLKGRLNFPEGKYVLKALKFPKIFYFLPQLLPMQFLKITELQEKDLTALEKDIDERPWVFGFKKFLSKDHHILGCEAPYNAFELSGLEDKIEQPYRDALIVYDFLKMYSREGHTCGKVDYVKSELRNYVRGFDAAVAFLTRNKIVKVLTINRVNWIFLHHLYHAEKMIAKYVDKMFRYQLENPWILDAEFQSDTFSNIRSDPDQVEAAKALTQLPVVVISGKGGCGKTTVVTKVMSNCDLILPVHLEPSKESKEKKNMRQSEETEGVSNNTVTPSVAGVQDSEWDSQCMPEDHDKEEDEGEEEEKVDPEENDWSKYPVIIYTAPTGKAANLLGKRATSPGDAMLGIRTPGYTLHQIIWSYRSFLKPPTEKEKEKLGENGQKKWKFKNVHTVVVDECSLVAVTTFETMISALVAEAKLRRIILLGDVRQLPSIEPGNFLADMFNILSRYGCSFELKTNHRSESQLIVDNATRISLRQYPMFDEERRFKLHPIPETQDNNFINDVILRILRKEKELQDDRSSQFVTFRNQTIKIINAIACMYYNSHTLEDHKNKKIFRQNDKICMKKNGMVTLFERDGRKMKAVVKKEEDEEIGEGDETGIAEDTMTSTQKKKEMSESNETVRLCNGEIFFIDEDFSEIDERRKETRYLHLNNRDPDDPRKFWVDFKELRKNCKINHSWARTIHTFQGSETETVVYVLGSTVSWQNWQHVYTAVTRGKKSVHIVGPDHILQQAVRKVEPKRFTKLAYQLVEKLPKPEEIVQLLHKSAQQEASNISSNSDSEVSLAPFTKVKALNGKSTLNSTLQLNGLNCPQPGPSCLQQNPQFCIQKSPTSRNGSVGFEGLHSSPLNGSFSPRSGPPGLVQRLQFSRPSVSISQNSTNQSGNSSTSQSNPKVGSFSPHPGPSCLLQRLRFSRPNRPITQNTTHMSNSLGSPQPGPSGLQPIRPFHVASADTGSPKLYITSPCVKPCVSPSDYICKNSPSNDSQWSEVDEMDLTSALESEERQNETVFAYTRLNSNFSSVQNNEESREISSHSKDSAQFKSNSSDIHNNSAVIEEYDSDDTQDPSNFTHSISKRNKLFQAGNKDKKSTLSAKINSVGGTSQGRDTLREGTQEGCTDAVQIISSDDEDSQSILDLKPRSRTMYSSDESNEELSQSILAFVPCQGNDTFEKSSVSDGDLTKLVAMVEADISTLEKSVNCGNNSLNNSSYRSPTLFDKSNDSGKSSGKEQDLSGYISFESDVTSSPSSPVKRHAQCEKMVATPKKPKLVIEESLSPARQSLSKLSITHRK